MQTHQCWHKQIFICSNDVTAADSPWGPYQGWRSLAAQCLPHHTKWIGTRSLPVTPSALLHLALLLLVLLHPKLLLLALLLLLVLLGSVHTCRQARPGAVLLLLLAAEPWAGTAPEHQQQPVATALKEHDTKTVF